MVRALSLGALLCSACVAAGESQRDFSTGTASAAILDGSDASHMTGVVHVSHAQSDEQCTGALVAPRVVLTAAHCAMADLELSTDVLDSSGFRVGAGATTDQLELWSVESVQAPQAAQGLTAWERGERGLDVVALILKHAPPWLPHEPAFEFAPDSTTVLELVGFGISSLDTGQSGEKRSGESRVIGWNRERGVLELEGAGACLGDSGGPALTEQAHWVGLVSSVSKDRSTPCGGRTYLSTLLNPDVASWLDALLDGAPEEDPATQPDEPSPEADAEPMPDEPGDQQSSHVEEAEVAPSCGVAMPARGSPWEALLVAACAAAQCHRRRRARALRAAR